MKAILALLACAGLVSAMPNPQEEDKPADDGSNGGGGNAPSVVFAAAAASANCECQCDPYIYRDHKGVHGNCQTTDGNGRYWCYIPPWRIQHCSDVRYSSSQRDSHGRFWAWSNEACATPALGSPQCSNGGYGDTDQ